MGWYIITKHAKEEMESRGIEESTVEVVMHSPGQIVDEKNGLVAYQSVVSLEAGRNMLIRIIATQGDSPVRIVTVYQTSKIDKYWRAP